MKAVKYVLLLTAVALASPVQRASAATVRPSVLPLLEASFLYGREYFVLRSGRTTMVVEADKVDLSPAVLYMVFDAHDPGNSQWKKAALNCQGELQGIANSALEVVLGGYPFTALGHETETRWTMVDGIPAVEAVWWAGGLRVRERILALADKNAFLRRITLTSANLGGAEKITLRLSMPLGKCMAHDGALVQETPRRRLVIAAAGGQPSKVVAEKGIFEIGPLAVAPGQSVTVDTTVSVEIPAAGAAPQWGPLPRPETALPKALEETRAVWAPGSTIKTADATVQELFNKVRYGLPSMVADNGVMNAGILEYGGQWVRDSSNTLLGMVHAGYFEQARRGFENILTHMVRDDGGTMVSGGFDNPDSEEFDQMGELIHALKAYRDWTGDDSLLRQYRTRLVAMVERPLRPAFRDATGMVHNRREFWERTFDDAYELAYQTQLVRGLRDAADLAEPLGAADHAARWRAEADRTLKAMLSHPTRALVEDGRLIKRRNTNGKWVQQVGGWGGGDLPGATERVHFAEPDASMALPIALGVVDPHSPLARKTLDKVEELWNARWFGGGYERYHSSGQDDQPGPWPFASCFVMRAEHDAGRWDRSRRTLQWLNTMQGGRAGAWFEEIPLCRCEGPGPGVLPWTSGEISLFLVHHLLGVRFEGNTLVLKPALYPNSPPVKADLRFRKGRLKLEISGAGRIQFAELNGRRVEPSPDGALRLPAEFEGGAVVLHTSGGDSPPH